MLEDGKRCEIQSFRLVRAAGEGDAGPAGAEAQATTSVPPPESSSPSRATLVVLVFGALNVAMAPSARRAAPDLLGRSVPPNTWFAVHTITWQGMRELQPFTSHRDRLRAAVLAATTGDDTKTFGPAVPSSPPAAGGGSAKLAHFGGRVEAATFKGLLYVVRSLASVRGRRGVVFFDTDHEQRSPAPASRCEPAPATSPRRRRRRPSTASSSSHRRPTRAEARGAGRTGPRGTTLEGLAR